MTAKRAYRLYLDILEAECKQLDYIRIVIMCSYYDERWWVCDLAHEWWAQLSYHERLKLKRVPKELITRKKRIK